MEYLKKNKWRLTLAQRIGIFVLLVIIISFEILFNFKSNVEKVSLFHADTSRYDALEEELSQLISDAKTSGYVYAQPKSTRVNQDSLRPFNPNDLPLQGWLKLGFSQKQAEVIMKYKQIIGGKFESKEQIKKCFVISDEVYQSLSPYILLPEKSKSDFKIEKYQPAKKVKYTRFNPNHYTEKDWMNIGFSNKQAEVILKYKKIVGGEFKSKEQIKKCFVVSDEKYAEMQAYIDLPEKIESQYAKKEIQNKEISESKEINSTPKPLVEKVEIKDKFNPNHLDLEGWMRLGFTEKQAQTILNFKRSVGGEFKDAKTLSRSYMISEEKFKEMEPFLVFE